MLNLNINLLKKTIKAFESGKYDEADYYAKQLSQDVIGQAAYYGKNQERTPIYEHVLSNEHDFKTYYSTLANFKIYDPKTDTLKKSGIDIPFTQMVERLEECKEQINNLPLIQEYQKKSGVNLCNYRSNSAEKASEMLFRHDNRDSRKWSGIVENLISISPLTYELSLFVFNCVIESIIDQKSLDSIFQPEYVKLLNQYLKASPSTNQQIYNGVNVDMYFKHYGAFLESLEEYIKDVSLSGTPGVMDGVLVEMMNHAGKTKTLYKGKEINALNQLSEKLKNIQKNKISDKMDTLTEFSRKNEVTPEGIKKLIELQKIVEKIDKNADLLLQQQK